VAHTLLAFDTDRIKDYVFATGKLRDIRGASALLDRLNRHRLVQLASDVATSARAVYAQGGGALILVDQAEADTVRLAVERLYREEAYTASITGVAVNVPAGVAVAVNSPDDIDDIHRWYHLLSYRLRAAKGRNPAYRDLGAHALLRPCEACGDEYASEDVYDEPEGRVQLCRGCARKRTENRRVKTDSAATFGASTTATDEPMMLWRRLVEDLRTRAETFNSVHPRPETFDDIGKLSRPSGYFGLIYADGDGMGRALEGLKTLKSIKTFATGVDQALYGAVVEAADQHLRPVSRSDQEALKFDVLFLGGDDLMMVTTADAAMDTAATLVTSFQRLTSHYVGRALRMSACVVLAHVSYPFSALRALAEDGLRFAKREADARAIATTKTSWERVRLAHRPARAEHTHGRARPRTYARLRKFTPTGLINFIVTSGTTYPTYTEYHERVLVDQSNASYKVERTLRPYTPDDLRRLLHDIRALSGASRSKLQQVREACFRDYYMGIVDARSALLRWPADGGADRVERLLDACAAQRGVAVDAFPWLGSGNVRRTPFVDVTDLFDFVVTETAEGETDGNDVPTH